MKQEDFTPPWIKKETKKKIQVIKKKKVIKRQTVDEQVEALNRMFFIK